MLITKTFPNITKRTIFFSIFRLAATNFNFILDFNENVEHNLSTCLLGIKLASTSLPSVLFQASCLGRVFKPSASDSRCNSVLCGFSFCFLSDFLPFLNMHTRNQTMQGRTALFRCGVALNPRAMAA